MRQRRQSLIAISIAMALVMASCGKDRQATPPSVAPAPVSAATIPATTPDTEPGTAASDTTTAPTDDTVVETVPVVDVPMFGDAPWPCGPGDGTNTDSGNEPGVTADSVSVGTGDDAGNAFSPGLNDSITSAINAMAAKCNELGGINGRTITVNYYDAKLFEAKAAMQAACDANEFYMLGEGWAFDGDQEEIRIGCGMPAMPTYTVSAAFAHAAGVYQAVPNPADETPSGSFEQMATLFPEEIKAAGTLAGNIGATRETRDKVIAVAPEFGWNFVSTNLEYQAAGETDWTPFVKQLQDAGVKLLVWSGSCLPNLQLFVQTAKANGFDVPILTDANQYEDKCAAANTDGALDKVYIRMVYTPFEEADANKATQDYLDVMAAGDGKTSLLGMQAATNFLLWATVASQCGAELTRACVADNASKVHEWTGHGLHAVDDPGGNHSSSCSTLIKLEGTTYVRVDPTEAGTTACKPNWISKVVGVPALEPLLLDENRVSHQFD